MTEAMRKQMGEAAVAAARAVNYVGAGTVEFIVEQRGQGEMNFFFMEMNTRLQVEHPVTEAITGLDLVEWQLRVASGEALPLKQDQLQIHGHAIEARICAENPDNNFLPATGTLHVYRKPQATAFQRSRVRIDDGVREGGVISPFYDSMIAKLIVHGATRDEALARLDLALAQTHIVGVATNVQFLRGILRTDSFANARLDTALIERERTVLFDQEPLGLPLAAADPLSRSDGWQLHGVAVRPFEFEFRGEPQSAELRYLHDGALSLRVGDVSGVLEIGSFPSGEIELQFTGQRHTLNVYEDESTAYVFAADGATRITTVDRLAHAGEVHAEGGRLTAPMPGKVVSFAVKAGDKVARGQALAVMEAMKMEHTIAAPADGTVQELLYAPGDQVAEGAELLTLGA